MNCLRYVSPKGHQFATCKEVSSYLMSLLGYPEAKTVAIQNSSTGLHDQSADDAVGLHQQVDSTKGNQSVLQGTSDTLPGHSGDSEKQELLHKDECQMDATNAQEQQKCNDHGTYVQHQLQSHQRGPKRRRVGKTREPVVGKDGKFECPVCYKTFEEKSRYFGHIGAHARYQGLSAEVLLGETSSGKVVSQSSLRAVPCGLQKLTDSPKQKKETSTGEPCAEHHNHSITNLVDHEAHDGARCGAEVVIAMKPATELNENSYLNNHESNSSKILELFDAGYSDNLSGPGKTSQGSEEVRPTTHASEYTNDRMDCVDITELKQVSQSSDLLDGKLNGSAGVTNFNDREESYPLSATLKNPHLKSFDMEVDDGSIAYKYDVVKPTSFEKGKPDETQITDEAHITDCGMAASKHDEVNNSVKTRDVNLNSCLDTVSSPISCANYRTSNALNEAHQSSITAKCFDATFNNDGGACKAEIFVDQNSAVVYQSNLSMKHAFPARNNFDCFNSYSMTSGTENNRKECEGHVKEQMVSVHNTSSNEAGFDIEAYNNDIFGGAITESNLAQLNNTIGDLKADFSSCYSLSELNTLTGGTSADEIDVNCMRSSFVNGSISRSEANEHSTLDFDIKGSMLKAMEKSDNELENRYNGGASGCDSIAVSGTSENIDLMSMQANFGSLSSLVRSVDDVPMGSILQDNKCDLQLGFGGQKQQMFPGFDELRLASAGPSQFGSIPRQAPVPVPDPTLMLGYAPQLGSGPPVQLGWDQSLSKMFPGCMLPSVCVWCNNQFHHFGSVAEQQTDSVGFICPACKEKISGHLSILNNGSSL